MVRHIRRNSMGGDLGKALVGGSCWLQLLGFLHGGAYVGELIVLPDSIFCCHLYLAFSTSLNCSFPHSLVLLKHST